MLVNKMILQIKESGLYQLDNAVYIGVLPNDGKIIAGYPQAILTFAEDRFIIYEFKGIRRFTFEQKYYEFKFSDIVEIEMGKYNFKNKYLKLVFAEEKFIAFQYFTKVRGYLYQEENINKFIEKLESIATVIEE